VKALPAPSAACELCGAREEGALAVAGFQCNTCIAAAVDAEAKRTRNRALLLIGAGVVLVLLAALLWSANVDNFRMPGYGRRMPLPVYVGIAGVGCAGIGFGMLRYRPKLKL